MNETRHVAKSKDVRDECTRERCCCICGKADADPAGGQSGGVCCQRQYGLTTLAAAPEWVKFLVVG